MNDLIVEDVAFIPLVARMMIAAVGNTLEGFKPMSWDTNTWNIKDWRRGKWRSDGVMERMERWRGGNDTKPTAQVQHANTPIPQLSAPPFTRINFA